MKHPVSFFQIQGGDPRALIKFYRKTFAWKGSAAPDGGLMVDQELGGIPGAVGPSSDGNPHLAVYITVDDVTRHLARAQRGGARIAMPETELPANLGSIGGMIDPAGNWVGLWAPATGVSTPARARKKSATKQPAKKEMAPIKKPAAKKKAKLAAKKKAKLAAKKKAKLAAKKKAKLAAKKKAPARKVSGRQRSTR